MNLGLPELIARSPGEFTDIAVQLAGDKARLAALRASLRQRMKDSVLTDAKSFTQGIESAYRQMWNNWCTSPDNGYFSKPQ
jgi:predicted O-linked N-acetylglucosamine transferase (SPINDLY family)